MRMGVTMVSSLPFFPFFHALSSFFLIIWRLSSWVLEAHLESFTSNQLPLKCESTVTFSLISSLRASPFPSNKLCKSRRNNLTNLNQTFYIPAVFFCFPLRGGRGHRQYILHDWGMYSKTLRCQYSNRLFLSTSAGCVDSLASLSSLDWKLDVVEYRQAGLLMCGWVHIFTYTMATCKDVQMIP